MIFTTRSIVFFIFFITHINGANLNKDQIKKVLGKKKSEYIQRGIFHTTAAKNIENFSIVSIKHFYSKKIGYERVVFKFSSDNVPKIYGSISSLEKKIYIDFFKSSLPNNLNTIGKSKYVKSVNFYPISKESLSVEVNLKESVSAEVFYLTSPGRFVIDLKSL